MTAVIRYILIVTVVIHYTCNDGSGNTLHLIIHYILTVAVAIRYTFNDDSGNTLQLLMAAHWHFTAGVAASYVPQPLDYSIAQSTRLHLSFSMMTAVARYILTMAAVIRYIVYDGSSGMLSVPPNTPNVHRYAYHSRQ